MPISETWLLPDGVTDVLPEQAHAVEQLRCQFLDFLTQRGYQLVYTPLIEYLESLSSLSKPNQDLDLATFKLIDQLSGRMLGIRADMTPQVARIDAHVRPINGVARYCYAGTILHTRPQGITASRTPLQLGAELYGHEGIEADIEMINIMLSLVSLAKVQQPLHLDLGHVGLFRSLVKLANLDQAQESTLSALYQRKALPELKEFIQDLPFGQDFYEFGRLSGDLTALKQNLSSEVLDDADFIQALSQLEYVAQYVQSCWSDVQIGIDVAELRGYHYHTGLMFAVYAPNCAVPLAQGGRYDGIGKNFGRERPATGFSCDLFQFMDHYYSKVELIVAPAGQNEDLQQTIASLRREGRNVVQLLGDDELSTIPQATHQLCKIEQQWQIKALLK